MNKPKPKPTAEERRLRAALQAIRDWYESSTDTDLRRVMQEHVYPHTERRT